MKQSTAAAQAKQKRKVYVARVVGIPNAMIMIACMLIHAPMGGRMSGEKNDSIKEKIT